MFAFIASHIYINLSCDQFILQEKSGELALNLTLTFLSEPWINIVGDETREYDRLLTQSSRLWLLDSLLNVLEFYTDLPII